MSVDVQAFLGLVLYALARLFSMSLIVQLALEPLYRWTGFIALEELVKAKMRGTGLRWPVAMAFSSWLCYSMAPPDIIGFDIIAELMELKSSVSGVLITAMAVTGGAAPFMALYAKFESFREKARTVSAQALAARSGGGS